MATAVRAPAPVPADRRPAALLPAGATRLLGFVGLALLGSLQWRRMVDGMPLGRPLLWVAAGAVLAAGVLAAERLGDRRRATVVVGLAVVALPVAWVVAGLDLGLLRPSRWTELGDGIDRGAQALSNVTLPYRGADPWPARVLEALGAVLVVLSGLLAVWPRGRVRGYPVLSLAALLALVTVPVVSIGGTRSVLLGVALAAITVVFLLLERLPLRPGLGVAALVGVALAGALPLGSAADRDQPWFDYRAFAESLGPKDPVRFDWDHGDYGPIGWKRTGVEVLRVRNDEPAYWKVRTLDGFDGVGWRDAPLDDRVPRDPPLPEDYRNRPGWNDRIEVAIQRLRGSDIVGAGTIVGVRDSTRAIRPDYKPGTWRSVSELRRGDSYTADVYVPRPAPGSLEAAAGVALGTHVGDLRVRIPLTSGGRAIPRAPLGQYPTYADVTFTGFTASSLPPYADYPQLGVTGDGAAALRHSPYARTWRLAQRLRRRAADPYDFIVAVDRHLQRGFRYDERPAPVPAGRAPLDGFLFDTRAGYCQHFSGAMALLLRMGGVPARVATGFSPGGYSKSRGAWIVRDTDAHSWVEVWFDNIGWVAFDPTPAATPARSQIAALDDEPQDASPEAGGATSIDAPGGAGGRRPGRNIRGDLLGDPLRDAGGAAGTGGGGVAAWWVALGVLGAALVAGLVALGWHLRRRRGRPAAELAIAELLAALRRTGRAAPTGTTLAQLERRLHLSGEAAAYLRALRADRYAPAAARPSEDQRRALRRELSAGAGLAGRLRVLWSLPPRPFAR